MTTLLGVVLILGILLWRTDPRLEWNIPIKWQTVIKIWQAKLSSKTQSLSYVCYLSPENCELERNLWYLQMTLPKLCKKFGAPLGVEVCVRQGWVLGRQEIYIACLQRRFPEIEIYECSLDGSSGNEGKI